MKKLCTKHNVQANPYLSLTPPQSPALSLMQLSGILPPFQPSLHSYIPSDGSHSIAAAQQSVYGQHGTLGGILPYNPSQFPASLPFNAMNIPPNLGMGYMYNAPVIPAASYGVSSVVTQTSQSSASSSSSTVPMPAANLPSMDGGMAALGHLVHRTVSQPSQSQSVIHPHVLSSNSTQNVTMHATHTRNSSDGQGGIRNYIPQRSQSNIEVQHVEAALAIRGQREDMNFSPSYGSELPPVTTEHRYPDGQQWRPLQTTQYDISGSVVSEGMSQTVQRDPKHSGPRLVDEVPEHTNSMSSSSMRPINGEDMGTKGGLQQSGTRSGYTSQESSTSTQKDSAEVGDGRQQSETSLEVPGDRSSQARYTSDGENQIT